MPYLGKENVMKALSESNRGYNDRLMWSQMYAATDIAAQQAESAVKYNFAKDVSDAYDAALAQKSAIYGSNYRAGVRDVAIDEIDLALEQAYNNSIANMQENVQKIDYSKQEAQSQITSALSNTADYMIKYNDYMLDYVGKLWEKDYEGKLFGTTGNFNRFVTQVPKVDANGNPVLDENGNQILTPTLMSKNEMYNMMYDRDGSLNLKGLDTYDMLLNDGEAFNYSFQDYLEEIGEDEKGLSQWTLNQNNIRMFKELVGLKPDDMTYNFSERLGGMSNEEIAEVLNAVEQSPTSESLQKLYDLAVKSGIDVSDIDNEGGVDYYLKQLDKETKTYELGLKVINDGERDVRRTISEKSKGWDDAIAMHNALKSGKVDDFVKYAFPGYTKDEILTQVEQLGYDSIKDYMKDELPVAENLYSSAISEKTYYENELKKFEQREMDYVTNYNKSSKYRNSYNEFVKNIHNKFTSK